VQPAATLPLAGAPGVSCRQPPAEEARRRFRELIDNEENVKILVSPGR
jgi:hypothetical protein